MVLVNLYTLVDIIGVFKGDIKSARAPFLPIPSKRIDKALEASKYGMGSFKNSPIFTFD